ncbi:hypothetical protein F8388_001161 [Cannabis sativa]|uniref:Uncharacterized protein n=1 Tax=Cannabis sativa TaxID=3483 RepID=A0A7J6ES66_CANSA|nr:hypothetical protein F8388_001161 [Cannabis sativa]
MGTSPASTSAVMVFLKALGHMENEVDKVVGITRKLLGVRSRAATRVHKIASHVVPCKTPPPFPEKRNDLGSLSIWPSQSMTMLSSSVAAGDDIQLNPTTLKPVASISPRKPAMLPLEGKYAKCRCREPLFEVTRFDLAKNRVLLNVFVVIGNEINHHVALSPKLLGVKRILYNHYFEIFLYGTIIGYKSLRQPQSSFELSFSPSAFSAFFFIILCFLCFQTWYQSSLCTGGAYFVSAPWQNKPHKLDRLTTLSGATKNLNLSSPSANLAATKPPNYPGNRGSHSGHTEKYNSPDTMSQVLGEDVTVQSDPNDQNQVTRVSSPALSSDVHSPGVSTSDLSDGAHSGHSPVGATCEVATGAACETAAREQLNVEGESQEGNLCPLFSIMDFKLFSLLVMNMYGVCMLFDYVPSLNDMRFLSESGSNSETKQIDTTNNRMGDILKHTLAKFLGTTTSNLLSASTKPWNTLAIFTWLRRNPRVFHPKTTTIQGGEEPFVSVKAKGVSSFYSVNEVSEFWANANAPSIGRIHVDPHSRSEWVNSSCGRCPDSCEQKYGNESSLNISSYGVSQSLGTHGKRSRQSCGDNSEIVGIDPCYLGSFLESTMSLVGTINDELSNIVVSNDSESSISCSNESTQDCLACGSL